MAESNAAIAERRFARLAQMPLKTIGEVDRFTPKSVVRSIQEVADQRELLTLLVKRDLKSRYKDSALGFLWALARPLMLLAIYSVVLGSFLGAARNIDNFAIYVFAGMTVMGLFQEIATNGTTSILANAGLVKKVYLPREVFPLATTGSALFNSGIQLIVLVIATFVVLKPPFHVELLYAIPSLLVVVVYGVAFALVFGAINVYLRDIQYLVEVAMMLVFWGSPVVYSWKMVHGILGDSLLMDLYTNNPLTLAVLGFQEAFWMDGTASMYPAHLLLRLVIALVVGLVLLLLSHRLFLRLQGNFAQEL